MKHQQTWLSNARLGERRAISFNPGMVRFQGQLLMFYRCAPQPGGFTHIRGVRLTEDFQPTGKPFQVRLPKVSDAVVTFDDPRAFVWNDRLWLMHTQSSLTERREWAACMVLSEISADGKVHKTQVPQYGKNLNHASGGAGVSFEKNWTPIVVSDKLFIAYTLDPLQILAYDPDSNEIQETAAKPAKNLLRTYLSGGTPLIPWDKHLYIAMYHTYVKYGVDGRAYSAGFYVVDTTRWELHAISKEAVIEGDEGRLRDLRRGTLERLHLRAPKYELFKVVFPSGIVDQGTSIAVSFGWNDCRSYVASYNKQDIAASLKHVATPNLTVRSHPQIAPGVPSYAARATDSAVA